MFVYVFGGDLFWKNWEHYNSPQSLFIHLGSPQKVFLVLDKPFDVTVPWFPIWRFFTCSTMSLEIFNFDVYRLDPSSSNNLRHRG